MICIINITGKLHKVKEASISKEINNFNKI